MELSTYWDVLRRWKLLVLAGTLLATALGVGLVIRGRAHAATAAYQASAVVVLNYTQPAGSPYNPTYSSHTEATNLSTLTGTSRALLGASAKNPPIAVTGLTAIVDQNSPRITVTVTAASSRLAHQGAHRVARYLADTENAKVGLLTRKLRDKWQAIANRDYSKWRALQTRYNSVCGCTAASWTRLISPGALARLSTSIDTWENRYTSANNQLHATGGSSQPAAVFTVGPTLAVPPGRTSPVRTVIPALLLGFLLSILLAAGLDYLLSAGRYAGSPPVGLRSRSRRSLRLPILGHMTPVLGGSSAGRRSRLLPHRRRTSAELDVSTVLGSLAAAASASAAVVSRLLDRGNRSIYFTSPTLSESKEEAVLGLGVALAAKGSRIVVVDSDPTGTITRFFGLERRPGLMDYLAYPGIALAQLVYPVDLPDGSAGPSSLAVLPLGLPAQIDDPSPQPIRPDYDQAWLSGLRELYGIADIVLVNGVAALAYPAALESARRCGGVVMVVRDEHTQDTVSGAYDVLRDKGLRVLGLILNPSDHVLSRSSPAALAVSGRALPEPLADAQAEYRESS